MKILEIGLLQLCEFIEDCEHTSLATRVIHLLGDQGPQFGIIICKLYFRPYFVLKKKPVIFYRGERYKVQGGGVYKVQGPENFSEKGYNGKL